MPGLTDPRTRQPFDYPTFEVAVERTKASQGGFTMRDVAGCSAEEVCGTLDVSEGNQRVLLHRARSHVRNALERHLDG